MCGRYSIHELEQWEQFLAERFREAEAHWPRIAVPRHNVAPSQDVPVLRLDREGKHDGKMMRWGLIPHWAKDEKIGYKIINAKAETLAGKPAFREPFRKRRCLIPASGFYEWRRSNGPTKQPYFIHLSDHAPMVFAGLWDGWRNPQGERIRSCSIVTTEPNARVAGLHDRMPAILPPEAFDVWLHGTTNEAADALRPFPADGMDMYPVSPLVNKADFDDPRAVERVDLVEGEAGESAGEQQELL